MPSPMVLMLSATSYNMYDLNYDCPCGLWRSIYSPRLGCTNWAVTVTWLVVTAVRLAWLAEITG